MNDISSTTTHFGIMRHAETFWNREKRIQGHLDSPLTPEGEKKAAGWGRQLKSEGWDRVVASDLGRARATAHLVNRVLGLSLHLDSMLREQDWGAWSGRRVEELLHDIPDLAARYANAGWNFQPPAGETRASVRRRAFAALCRAAERWPGDKILVVTHAGTIRCLINGLTGRRFLPSEPPILWSGYLHCLLHEGEALRVERLNAVALDAARPPRPPTEEADFITMDTG